MALGSVRLRGVKKRTDMKNGFKQTFCFECKVPYVYKRNFVKAYSGRGGKFWPDVKINE